MDIFRFVAFGWLLFSHFGFALFYLLIMMSDDKRALIRVGNMSTDLQDLRRTMPTRAARVFGINHALQVITLVPIALYPVRSAIEVTRYMVLLLLVGHVTGFVWSCVFRIEPANGMYGLTFRLFACFGIASLAFAGFVPS